MKWYPKVTSCSANQQRRLSSLLLCCCSDECVQAAEDELLLLDQVQCVRVCICACISVSLCCLCNYFFTVNPLVVEGCSLRGRWMIVEETEDGSLADLVSMTATRIGCVCV